MMKKRHIRKRSFLLFELLISLLLLSLCLTPLIKPHMGIRKNQMDYLKEMELEITAQNIFCEFKQALHEHQYPFDMLSKWEGPFEGAYIKLSKLDRSTKQHTKDTGLVLGVDLRLEGKDKPFKRTLYVQRVDQWQDELLL